MKDIDDLQASGKNLTDSVPDPQTIRERLAENLQESRILGQLLKVSDRIAKNQEVVRYSKRGIR